MNADDAARVAASLGFPCDAPPEPLAGGNLNWVFRVRRRHDTAVLKVAPPYVARVPEIPLDAGRSQHERRGLQRAAEVLGARRVPAVWAHDEDQSALLLEDLAPADDLGDWLRADRADVDALLVELGQALGQLHATATGPEDEALAQPAVQATRLAVQYARVPEWLAEQGHDPALGSPVVELGRRLVEVPGRCLVMGDLWPPSVLLRASGDWALIDWELCHFGRPLQDVAHLRAHLWLAAPTPAVAVRWAAAFDRGYRATAPPWPEAEHADALRHEAAELLARSVGAFPVFDPRDPRRAAMVTAAVERLRRSAAG